VKDEKILSEKFKTSLHLILHVCSDGNVSLSYQYNTAQTISQQNDVEWKKQVTEKTQKTLQICHF
jgi:hypothetical protein